MRQERNDRLAQRPFARIMLRFQSNLFDILGDPTGELGNRLSMVALG